MISYTPVVKLDVRSLSKRYGRILAVDAVSFAAPAGKTLGVLGPNGAGKTTTASMIAGLLTPDSGEVLIEGRAALACGRARFTTGAQNLRDGSHFLP